MAKYVCTVCGEIYDEEREGVPFKDLPDDWKCPLCGSPKSAFVLKDGSETQKAAPMIPEEVPVREPGSIEVDPALVRTDGGDMDEIRQMSYTGKAPGAAMETLMPVPNFRDILFLGAQLGRFPLADDADVDISVTIGKHAKRPMTISSPVYVSHMSFGALSGTAKVALARGATAAGTAMCSGEGGALHDEMAASEHYIFELAPNRYSDEPETYEASSAVEIKIGQGTKPGMGGHLPGEKVTPVIAMMRGKRPGRDILSPSRFPGIDSPGDLKNLVDELRKKSEGLPIGVKIAAGHIEDDLAFIAESGCDFITIDGRGGATGSSPRFLRDASSVPTVYALARARRFMDEHGMPQDLVMTGGFRTGGDVVKALCMGADAVAMASAPLMALGCQRYRVCGGGRCPMGIATQDPELERRLDEDAGAKRVENWLNAMAGEMRTFLRVSGHRSLSELSMDDLCTVSDEMSKYTGIRHARSRQGASGPLGTGCGSSPATL